jgi:hypothetical protein
MTPAIERSVDGRCARTNRFFAPVILAGLTFGCFGLGLAVNAINTESLVTSAFDRTFAALTQPRAPVQVSRTYTGVVGTEDFWLRANGDANLIKAVSVGQRLVLTTNGASRELTVTDVRTNADEATHIDTGRLGSSIVLITCLDTSSGVEQRLRLRIEGGRIVEVPAADELGPSQSARAL